MKYDTPITSSEHAEFCRREAQRRYAGKLIRHGDGMLFVEESSGILHTDPVLRALSMYPPTKRRRSECFFQHTCFERFTANKVAAFLRAGQKNGNYFVRISQRRKSASYETPPWKREYWYAVRVYRKVALLLLGWYLLMPPWTGPMRFDPAAPFSRWEITAAYDTANDCQSELMALTLVYKAHPSTYEFEHPDAGYLRCIASDDPRLAY